MYELVINGEWIKSAKVGRKFNHPTKGRTIIGANSTAESLKANWDLWPRVSDPKPTPDLDLFNEPELARVVDVDGEVVNFTYEVTAKTPEELAAVVAARKKAKIELLKVEGLKRINVIFPAISTWDEILLVKENWLSIAPAARNPTTKFLALINTFIAGSDAADEINAMANIALIDAYSVVTGPGWP